MKSKWLIMGLVTTALLVLTACSTSAKQVSADDSSSGKQIDIAIGGTLTVTLDSNQTTGFSWELKEIGDTNILQKMDSKYVAPTSNMVGAGGKEVWNFKALKGGTTTLSMDYSQPWAGGQKDVKSFNLTVAVK
jgi:inhibitor of cysteine peptidase